MSSPVVLTGLALWDLARRADADEARRRRALDREGDASSSEDEAEEDDVADARAGATTRRDVVGTSEEDEATRVGARATSASGDAEDGDVVEAIDGSEADDVDADERGVCRFCFTGAECGRLIEPCACAGSQRFVHRRCLRRWFLVGLESRGVAETTCRVCHERYTYESTRIARACRQARWFSLTARDRLNEYRGAWLQWASNALLRRKGVAMRRSASSASNLALLVAESEVRLWARREETREGTTSHLPKLLRVGANLLRAASTYAKLRLLLTAPNAVATVTVA